METRWLYVWILVALIVGGIVGYFFGKGQEEKEYNESLETVQAVGVTAGEGSFDYVVSAGVADLTGNKTIDESTRQRMDELTGRMMSGDFSKDDQAEVIQLMRDYPSFYAAMMDRFGPRTGSPNVLSGGGSEAKGLSHWMLILLESIWTLVGILAALFLLRKLSHHSAPYLHSRWEL